VGRGDPAGGTVARAAARLLGCAAMNDTSASLRRQLLAVSCLALLLLAGCKKSEEAAADPAGAPAGGETGAYGEATAEATPATPAGAPQLTAVDLPDAFPREVPLPPGGTVTEAGASSDDQAVNAHAALTTQQEAAALFGWYKQAFADAGWTIESEGQSGTSRQLRAVKGEAAVDVTVDPHENAGWSQAHLSIYWPTAAAA
jgi:hypothetical protein